jgi:hypothetical protein
MRTGHPLWQPLPLLKNITQGKSVEINEVL